MTHSRLEWAGRIRTAVPQWFQRRLDECVHCRQCESVVTPWESYCPNCGQGDPARLSPSAAVYLVLGFALLAIVVSSLILIF
jgi:hypothetical protein